MPLLPLLALLAFVGALALTGFARPAEETLPPPIAREFRGAWVTPLTAGTAPDWPSRAGLPADSQKAELIALLDHAKAIGLNAIILHVRTAADALYPTNLAPWSAFLSGTSGVAPEPVYDPLAFAVEQAHARGLQLHAWFNPFRAILPNIQGKAAATHVTRTKPTWIRRYGSQTWIDPGDPTARAAVLAAIFEVVERYDIDAVHIDDYFYPYREQRTVTRKVGKRTVRSRVDIPFPDNTTWTKYGAKQFSNRADWRRANVDSFVHALHDGVRKRKPWVAVGISPFGIWRSGTPAGVTGLDAYGEIYADARKWLREGWLDYLAPQLYWQLDGVQRRFIALDAWWRSQNPRGRHIWPGLHTAQVFAARPPWSTGEIAAQIERVRADRATIVQAGSQLSNGPASAAGTSGVATLGHVHFRFGALTRALSGRESLGLQLRDGTYEHDAVVPAMPWLASPRSTAPAPPLLTVLGPAITLTPGDSITVSQWVVQSRSRDGGWRTRVIPGSTRSYIPSDSETAVAVTAVDRIGRASAFTVLDPTAARR
jgi:uncharacterized lipoprotein YddW (UPF0748 family)